MKAYKYFLLAGIILVLFACKSSQQRATEKIEKLNAGLFPDSASIIDREKALELTNLYVQYAENYPEDVRSPEYLYKAGELAMNIQNGDLAVKVLQRILNNYPDFEKAAESLFLLGFVYENTLNDLRKAREIYNQFIAKYPYHEFADDAEISINNLGIPPEQLIEMFEKNAAEDSLKAAENAQ